MVSDKVTLQNKVERIKKFAAKLVTTSLPHILSEKLSWKPLSQLAMEKRLQLAHHYIHGARTLRLLIKQFTESILDDVLLGAGFKFHREMSIGRHFIPSKIFEAHETSIIETFDRTDIFGNEPTNSRNHRAPDCVKCICLECNQPIAAARFAPHLEKCIGMGRNSSRVARKRLAASYAKRNNSPLDELDIGDEATSEDAASYGFPEEDDEWTRKRKSKTRTKRPKKAQDGTNVDDKKRVINFS